jgi:hypothetical protein
MPIGGDISGATIRQRQLAHVAAHRDIANRQVTGTGRGGTDAERQRAAGLLATARSHRLGPGGTVT